MSAESSTTETSTNRDNAEEKDKLLCDVMKNRLRKYIKKLDDTNKSQSKAENLKVECESFSKLYKQKLNGNEESYKQIPKFYFKRNEDLLNQKLRETTTAQFLKKKTKELLHSNELELLWGLLKMSSDSGKNNNDLTIDYLQFKKIREEAGPKFRPFLTTEMFGRLQAAEGSTGQVRIDSLFSYVMRRGCLQQMRIGLTFYDVTGQGYLTEHDLESYIKELVPTLVALEGLDSSFTSFYVCTATRKFMFFLDPMRIGRVRIKDLLSCSFLEDLGELREEDLPKELQEKNWFSAPSALRVYGNYLHLDTNHNGMLSIDELAGFGSGTLTRAFLERVFQQCLTYDGEMDYKTYLDFVLALENRKDPASLAYLFRLIDINGQGYLDAFTLNYFFKAIQEQLTAPDSEPVDADDVKDEIFDMVRPEDPTKITLKDLVRSGKGHTVLSMLIEVKGFLAYNNRENMISGREPS